jgi:hypothetical protein
MDFVEKLGTLSKSARLLIGSGFVGLVLLKSTLSLSDGDIYSICAVVAMVIWGDTQRPLGTKKQAK